MAWWYFDFNCYVLARAHKKTSCIVISWFGLLCLFWVSNSVANLLYHLAQLETLRDDSEVWQLVWGGPDTVGVFLYQVDSVELDKEVWVKSTKVFNNTCFYVRCHWCFNDLDIFCFHQCWSMYCALFTHALIACGLPSPHGACAVGKEPARSPSHSHAGNAGQGVSQCTTSIFPI